MFNNYFFLFKKEDLGYCLNNFSGYLKIQQNDNLCSFNLVIENLNPNNSYIYKCYLLSIKNCSGKVYYVGDLEFNGMHRLCKKVELNNSLLDGLHVCDYDICFICTISDNNDRAVNIICSSNRGSNYSWKSFVNPNTLGLVKNITKPVDITPQQNLKRDKPTSISPVSKIIASGSIDACYFKKIFSILSTNFTPISIKNIDINYTFYDISDYNVLSYLFFSYGLGHLLLSQHNCDISFDNIKRIAIGINIDSEYMLYLINDSPIYLNLTTGNRKTTSM